MDILTPAEIDAIAAKSKLVPKYNQVIDNESAYEILTQKLQDAANKNQPDPAKPGAKPEPSTLDKDPEQRSCQTGGKNSSQYDYQRSAGRIGSGWAQQQFKKSGWF